MKKIYFLAAGAVLLSLFALLALPVLADEVSETTTVAVTTTAPAPTTTAKIKGQFDPVCLAMAIDNRDTALINAVDAYGLAVKNALGTRKEALKTAWAVTNVKDRKVAVKKAWADFKKSHKLAATALRKAKKSAWSAFDKEKKVCNMSLKDSALEFINQAADSAL
ncbi:MAG: hypothetical protein WC516_00855 [Patescibacteria group bacterium]